MSKLIFNCIYTHGTVNLLLPMASSLITHNDIKLRLISNGCSKDEILILRNIAANNENILFYNYQFEKIVPHHEVLNHIFELDNDKYFCFLDSDIFCTSNFITSVIDDLNNTAALFSCKPISESPKEPELERLQGRHFHARKNRLVGGSYFAIYNRSNVKEIIKKTGLKFNRMEWVDIDHDIQSTLVDNALKYSRYDTAKLLNIFLHLNNYKLKYTEYDTVFHIGGLSWNTSINGNKKDLTFNVQNVSLKKAIDKRYTIASYFTDLIEALTYNKELPQLNRIDNLEEQEKIKLTAQKIIDLYQKRALFSAHQ